MTTSKVFIGTRFDSDRVKALEKIAKKLHISRNAVIENAFDIYVEAVLGVLTPSDNTFSEEVITPSVNTIQILEDRIKALELMIESLQPEVITPSVNTKKLEVLTPLETPQKTPQVATQVPPKCHPETPQIKLSAVEFRDRFNFSGDLDDGYVRARKNRYFYDDDDAKWMLTGYKDKAVWTKE